MRLARILTSLVAACLFLAGRAEAETIEVAPGVYEITAGVEFSVSNVVSSDYLFSWSDGSGTYTDVVDPTFVLRVGETYTFTNTTSFHPLLITDDTLPVTGDDGTYARTTTSASVIADAVLSPAADFTAETTTSDPIVWTPGAGDVGNYFYTCEVTSHVGMTGAIRIETAPLTVDEETWSSLKSLFEN